MPKDIEVIDLTGDAPVNVVKRNTRSKRALLEQAEDLGSKLSEARSKRPRRQQQAEADFDDLIIVQETGKHVLKDLAHQRPQCGNHAFSESDSRSNAQCCSQCYCFVCDVKASVCKSWGNGSKPTDHCNAHRSSHWNSIKRAVRRGETPAAAAAAAGAGEAGEAAAGNGLDRARCYAAPAAATGSGLDSGSSHAAAAAAGRGVGAADCAGGMHAHQGSFTGQAGSPSAGGQHMQRSSTPGSSSRSTGDHAALSPAIQSPEVQSALAKLRRVHAERNVYLEDIRRHLHARMHGY